jgi:hypothetical protein
LAEVAAVQHANALMARADDPAGYREQFDSGDHGRDIKTEAAYRPMAPASQDA